MLVFGSYLNLSMVHALVAFCLLASVSCDPSAAICGTNADDNSTCVSLGDQAALLQSHVRVEASSDDPAGSHYKDYVGRMCNKHGRTTWVHGQKTLAQCKEECDKTRCKGLQSLGVFCLLFPDMASPGNKGSPKEVCSIKVAGGGPPAPHPPAPRRRHAPTPAPESPQSGFSYVGCYKDTGKPHDLAIDRGHNYKDACAKQCKDYKYFGVQWTGECRCGNSYGKYGTSTECKCDASNVGGWVNCVYTHGSGSVPNPAPPPPPMPNPPPPPPPPPQSGFSYVGCYKDTGKPHDLPVSHAGHHYKDDCAKICKDYKYFGVQWNGQCYCGNSYGKYGTSTGCKCDADNVGGWVNCVYKLGA